MAKGKFIKILEILRGKAAGLIVRRRPDGSFIFSKPPSYKKRAGLRCNRLTCLKPPVIYRVERAEGCIRVQATDNVLVDGVCVSILDEDGRVLEAGNVIRGAEYCWEFSTLMEGKTIVAQVVDMEFGEVRIVEIRTAVSIPLENE